MRAVPRSDDVAAWLRVKDEDGAWRTLRAGESIVTLVADQPPSNWRSVRIEVQVVGASGPRAVPSLSLDLQPAQR